jgi:hypothetical protein
MNDLTFACETAEHVIAVSDGGGRRLFAFGGFGRQPGAFDSPIDAILVRPEFFGEPVHGSIETTYLAVADYGNARVQLFDLHGVLVAAFSDELDAIGRPCRLTWRAPFLDIEGVDGVRTRIHLGAALLAQSAAQESTGRPAGRPARDIRWAVC